MALTGLHPPAPIPASSGSCSPAAFVSSTGASFTHGTAQVSSSATTLPATATAQVKDSNGNVIGTGSGLGAFSFPLAVPAGATVPLSAVVTVTGVFTDYQAAVTITLS